MNRNGNHLYLMYNVKSVSDICMKYSTFAIDWNQLQIWIPIDIKIVYKIKEINKRLHLKF